MENALIRKFSPSDRNRVREISCETSFLGAPRKDIFADDELLADALTGYFTDYEPESCFVALVNREVVGYLIGSKDVNNMGRVFSLKIMPGLLAKAIKRNTLLGKVNLRFLFYYLSSLSKREFSMPDFSREFPGALHINIDQDHRGRGIGRLLIENYLGYLREEKVPGVHFGSLSEGAKIFFTKMGFQILFQGKRSYLKPYLGKEVNFYLFGKRL